MKITCFISLLLYSFFACAQTTNSRPIVTSSYAVDSNSSWNKADINPQKLQPFKEGQKIDIGYNKNAAVWCRFVFKNASPTQSVITWLCFNNNHIDSLTLYDGDATQTIGDRTAMKSPFIKALAFELNLRPGEEKLCWARIKKETSFLDFSYNLEDQAYLEAKSSQTIALTGFLIGIVFLLLMINAILFLLTRNRLYIYYIACSLLTVCYVAISTNFAKHVLFPEFRFFSEGRIYAGALWYIALSFFLNHFLKLKENQPAKYRVIIWLNAINVFIVLSSVLLLFLYRDFEFRYLFVLGYAVFLASIVILFWSTLLHLKIERTQAFYALLAFAPQLIWGACFILKTFGLITTSPDEHWMLVISLYEVFLFGYVLSKNYIEIFLKNGELMEQVILEKESSLKTINEVQLRERRNIANIIHDKVGSKIAHILHLFDMKNAGLAKETISELAEDIRDISHKILPKALDDGALFASLQSQITSLNAGLSESKIELFGYDFPEKIEEPWVYDMYLIALEIISNALKHGRSSLVTIEFYQYSNYYHFQFIDDGLGFDVQHTRKGFGISNIEKRINYYKGHFELSSAPNEGTIIQLSIPFGKN